MKQYKHVYPLIMIIILTLLSNPPLAYSQQPEITAPSAILIDAATGDVLYEKNSHEIMYPASTTKVMTAILVLENTDLDNKVVIDKETPFTDGSRIYVMEDEVLTVEQLLYALIVDSANDAAVALAKYISGSVEDFAKLMNKRAKELGALNTNFVNPNGLPNDEHVSTAYDLAMITRHAMTLPQFVELVKTVRYQIPPTNKQAETRYLKTSNRFLWGEGGNNKILYKGKWIDIKYDKIEGIKTGYTVQAQQCLITSASEDGHRFISVVLKATGTDIYIDSRTLIDYGLEDFRFIEVVTNMKTITTVEVNNGIEDEVDIGTQNSFFKALPKDIKLEPIESEVIIEENIRAPIQKNDILGKIVYKMDSKLLGEVNLVAMDSVPLKNSVTSVHYFGKTIGSKFITITLFTFILFIIWRTIVTFLRLNKRKRGSIHKRKKQLDLIRQTNMNKTTGIYKKK